MLTVMPKREVHFHMLVKLSKNEKVIVKENGAVKHRANSIVPDSTNRNCIIFSLGHHLKVKYLEQGTKQRDICFIFFRNQMRKLINRKQIKHKCPIL